MVCEFRFSFELFLWVGSISQRQPFIRRCFVPRTQISGVCLQCADTQLGCCLQISDVFLQTDQKGNRRQKLSLLRNDCKTVKCVPEPSSSPLKPKKFDISVRKNNCFLFAQNQKQDQNACDFIKLMTEFS